MTTQSMIAQLKWPPLRANKATNRLTTSPSWRRNRPWFVPLSPNSRRDSTDGPFPHVACCLLLVWCPWLIKAPTPVKEAHCIPALRPGPWCCLSLLHIVSVVSFLSPQLAIHCSSSESPGEAGVMWSSWGGKGGRGGDRDRQGQLWTEGNLASAICMSINYLCVVLIHTFACQPLFLSDPVLLTKPFLPSLPGPCHPPTSFQILGPWGRNFGTDCCIVGVSGGVYARVAMTKHCSDVWHLSLASPWQRWN